MKLRWIAAALCLAILTVMGAVAFVAARVPVNFTATVPGILRPARRIRVTAAAGGEALEVRLPGPVDAGDLLFRLDADSEKRRIGDIDGELALLEKRLAHERERLQSEASARRLELELLAVRRREIENTVDEWTGQRAETEDALQDNLAAQTDTDRELAAAEYGILKKLAAELSVPAMELARGKASAARSALQVEQKALEATRLRLQRQAEVKRLSLSLERLAVEKRQAEHRFDDRRPILELEQSILLLTAERRELNRAVARKTMVAPWPGFWGDNKAATGEYIRTGDPVGVLSDTKNLVFVGRASEERFTWLRRGQAAKLRIHAFPYLKYGRLPARVIRLETRPNEVPPAFLAELIPAGDDLGFRPAAGQRGRADIVVFRGTFLNYLLADPGDACEGPPDTADEERFNLPRLLDLMRKR